MEMNLGDVRKAVKNLKKGNSLGVNEITSEMLSLGDEAVLEWLIMICKICLAGGVVPLGWQRTIIDCLYKGKSDRSGCKNYRGISLISVLEKVNERVLIERAHVMTEGIIGEGQCGYKMGRGCVDQVFSLKQLS